MSYTALLSTTITIWETPVNDGYANFSYSTPTQVSCRYQNDRQNLIDDLGMEFVSTAVIYTTQQLALNTWVYKGTTSTANPQNVDEAYRVRKIYTTSTPTDSIIVYKAILG